MSTGAYLLAVALLCVLVGSLAFTGVTVRQTLLPGWSGPPARVAEAVVALTVLIVLAELLGSVDGFERWPLILAVAAFASVAGEVRRRFGAVAATPVERVAHEAPSRGGAVPVVIAAVAIV